MFDFALANWCQRLASWPLSRIFRGITTIVLCFLCIVILLACRQYLLYNQCRQAVNGADHLLFEFSTIKGHLNESLLLHKNINPRSLNQDLQLLDKESEDLRTNILVPDSLKGSLLARVDLVDLEVRLRALQEETTAKTNDRVALLRKLQGMDINLQQFRARLSDYTQTILLGLHRSIAGALGLIVALSSILLILLNRHLALPLLALRQSLGARRVEKSKAIPESLRELRQDIEELLQHSQRMHDLLGLTQAPFFFQSSPESPPYAPLCRWLRQLPTVADAGLVRMEQDHVYLYGPAASEEHEELQRILLGPSQQTALEAIYLQVQQQDKPETVLVETEGEAPLYLLSLPLPQARHSSWDMLALYTSLLPTAAERDFLDTVLQHPLLPANHTSSLPTTKTHDYRFSIIGSLCLDLASELANQVNGALNYTQTLIDSEPGAINEAKNRLYQGLTKEVRKMANLIQAIQAINHGGGHPTAASMEVLLEHLLLLNKQQFRRESITCTIACSCTSSLLLPAADLLLVLLTITERARQVLTAQPGNKSLHFSCRQHPAAAHRCQLSCTNSAHSWTLPASQVRNELWPSLEFCTQLLQHYDAVLSQHDQEQTAALVIDLPLATNA